MSGKASKGDDHPLGFHWKPLDASAFSGLGLPPAQSAAEEATRLSVLTEAYLVGRANPERRISYSRRTEWYSAAPRYRGTSYTYTTILRSVDALTEAGLLDHDKAAQGSRGYQSTFRASSTLIAQLGGRPLPVLYDPAEIVRLRNDQGKAVEYRDTDRSRDIRKRLREINEAAKSAAVAHPELGMGSERK